MKNLTEKRKKKEKYSYLIAFNLKGVDQTMGSNEDPSAPLPSFLGCPAISPTGTALWPDQQADGVLDNSRPPRASWPGKGGSYGGGRRGSRRAGGAPAPGPGLSS